MKGLRITAAVNGYYVAGRRHSSQPTDVPADEFDDDEIAELMAHPKLTVEEVEMPDRPAGKGKK